MQTACNGSQAKALAHERACETTWIEIIQIVKPPEDTGFPLLDWFVLFIISNQFLIQLLTIDSQDTIISEFRTDLPAAFA